jgi:hypothetical protein
MAEKINWNFVVQSLNGPSVSGAGVVSLLGGAANISFTNNTGADATLCGKFVP